MTYKVIDLQQGSQSWLEFRKNHITGTDVGTIMGLNPYKTPYKLYQEKMGLIECEPENDAMREGKMLESEALDYFNEEFNSDFRPVVLVSKQYPFLMASLDGMNSKGKILEIKCGKKSYEQLQQDDIPEYYYAQMQAQAFVSGSEFCTYFCYRSKEENKSEFVQRNYLFTEKMIEACKEFYQRMLDFNPPEMTDRDYVKRDDDLWLSVAEQLKEAKDRLKYAEELEKTLREQLIVLSNGQSSMGGGIRLSKSHRKGNISYKNIPELQNVDLEKYRGKSTEFYRITDIAE